MAHATSRLLLPFPDDHAVVNGPLQVEELAKRLDLVVPKFYTPRVIATKQTRASETFGTMTTADEIKGVVLPEDCLMLIGYSALVECSDPEAGSAAIFLNSNQFRSYVGTPQEATLFGSESLEHLITNDFGLSPEVGVDVAGLTSGTGVGLPAPLAVFAEPGTYDVSVKFKATSGSISAEKRKLWVIVYGNA